MNKPFIPTEEQFKKLQKLYTLLKLADSPTIPSWMTHIDKIHYNKNNDEWISFVEWAEDMVHFKWDEIFKDCNKLWKGVDQTLWRKVYQK